MQARSAYVKSFSDIGLVTTMFSCVNILPLRSIDLMERYFFLYDILGFRNQ